MLFHNHLVNIAQILEEETAMAQIRIHVLHCGKIGVAPNLPGRPPGGAPRCAIGLAFWERLWYNGRKAAGGRLPWLGPRPASCGTAARSTRSPRGVAQQPQRQRTAPVGGPTIQQPQPRTAVRGCDQKELSV